jgi:hypothetical protein
VSLETKSISWWKKKSSIVIYIGLISISHNIKSEFMWRLETHMSIIIRSVNSSGHAKFSRKFIIIIIEKASCAPF